MKERVAWMTVSTKTKMNISMIASRRYRMMKKMSLCSWGTVLLFIGIG